MTELKPCPWCGAKPEVLSDGRRTWGLVEHHEGCLFPTFPKHEIAESNFEAWNTRAPVEYDGWFYLPKPKENVVQYGAQRIEKTETGYMAEQSVGVIEGAIRSWGDEMGEHIMKRICEVWNIRTDRHPYEQRIVGDGSDWGEIMRDAYDDLMASAGESCTPEQMERLADCIRAELGNDAKPCYATDYTHNHCKYSTNRGWTEDTKFYIPTVRHGTLTAEQVRECVQHVYYEGYNDGSVHRSHGIEETDWQAIADELNAELGNGTCENVSDDSCWFECSSCKCTCSIDWWGAGLGEPNHCPNCGAKVKAVKR